jgi:very-short-patch-repair endonuclease
LRNYLQYAASNGRELGDADVSGEPLNAFESEVFDCLEAAGLKLIPQMGASQFRIDMVAEHPAKPGRYVLAIECDGATYHSSYTARDRDRLRQQQLENLGWRFHRIWSTDWFMRREEEIQRAIRAYQGAVDFADRLDRGATPDNHHGNGNSREHASAAPAYLRRRGPRPAIPVRSSLRLPAYRPGMHRESSTSYGYCWIAQNFRNAEGQNFRNFQEKQSALGSSESSQVRNIQSH